MRRMPITDAFFLLAESRRTPMHVGGLNLFTLPKDVDDTTFLNRLGEILSYDGELRRPFGEKLKTGPLGVAGNIFWEEEDEMDMDYHIRHSALPKPGRFRELFALWSVAVQQRAVQPTTVGDASDRGVAESAVCRVLQVPPRSHRRGAFHPPHPEYVLHQPE